MRKPSPPDKPEPEPEPEKFECWTGQRKAAIILEVLKCQISVPEVCRKHGITQVEFRAWAVKHHRGNVDALEVNKKTLEAEYGRNKAVAGQNRRARDGKRYMPEAIRPFISVARTLNGSPLDDDGLKP